MYSFPSNLENHVEIDIETLGVTPGDIILSIGAVRFDPRLGRIKTYEEFLKEGKTLKVVLNLAESKSLGFTIDKDTQTWWDKQSEEAKAATFDTGLEIGVKEGLVKLQEFISPKDSVWGNGANFDTVMLEAYFKKLELKVPWKYYKVQCYRTLKALLGYNELLIPPNKIKHDCLADAVYQAQVTQAIYVNNPGIKLERD